MAVIFCLIILVVISLVLYFGDNADGTKVVVKVGGEIAAELPLSEPTEYEINTIYGTNTLVIENGAAFVREADCRDKICVNQGKINKYGESIICLPHKVIIEVAR